MKASNVILLALLTLFCFVLVYFVGYRTAQLRPPVEIRIDTVEVVRIDTVMVDRPVVVYRRTVDTMLLAVHDTTRVRDTLYQTIPREQVEYSDSTYRAWVSGYRPALDSIRLYVPVKCVTITETVPVEEGRRWGLGVTAGYGASLQQGGVVLAPYVGLGLTYNLLTW